MNARDNIDGRIDSLLRGAIDPHVHSGPSIASRALDQAVWRRLWDVSETLTRVTIAGRAAA